MQNVQEGSSSEVLIVNVEDPDNFTVQLCEQQAILSDMMDQLHEFCMKNSESCRPRYCLNDFIVAKYNEDGGWYRARVTGIASLSISDLCW